MPVLAIVLVMAALAPSPASCGDVKGYHFVLRARFVPEKTVDLTAKGLDDGGLPGISVIRMKI